MGKSSGICDMGAEIIISPYKNTSWGLHVYLIFQAISTPIDIVPSIWWHLVCIVPLWL